MRPVDITGMRSGKLVAVAPTDMRKNGKIVWECICDCGNTTFATSNDIKMKYVCSCGCNHVKKHGMTGTRIYHIWKAMNQRCKNSNRKDFKNYGAMGISVCQEWSGKHGFENFYKWAMENGYEQGLTIDRIDLNKDYEPNNCRWATRHTQDRNRRNNINITAGGKTMCLADWTAKYGNHIHYLYWHKGKAEAVKWLEEQEVKKWELLSNTN